METVHITKEQLEQFHDDIQHGDTYEISKKILKNSNYTNERLNMYTSPLLIACIYDQGDVAKLLLMHDADIKYTDSEGWNALHCAVIFASLTCIPILLQYGIDYTLKIKSGIRIGKNARDLFQKEKDKIWFDNLVDLYCGNTKPARDFK